MSAMLIWTLWMCALAWATINCEPPVNSYLPPDNGASNVRRPSAQYGSPGSGNGSPGIDNGQRGSSNQNQPQDSYNQPGQFGRPDTEYGPPNQGFGQGQRQRFNSQTQRGSTQRQGNNNAPSAQYGVPEQSSGIKSGPARNVSPFGNRDSNNRQNLNNGISGGSSNDPRPQTSYGPPPSGAFQPTDRSTGFRGQSPNQQTGSLRAPETSYGAPESDGSQNGFNGGQFSGGTPSNSYSTPGFGGSGKGFSNSGSPGGDNGESDEPAKYEFSYDVDDTQTGTKFGHSEQRDGDVATGEYNVVLPDGRKQVVEYEAGLQGYKPQIRYEGGVNTGGGSGAGDAGFGFGNGQNGDNGYPRGGPGISGANNPGYQQREQENEQTIGSGGIQRQNDFGSGAIQDQSSQLTNQQGGSAGYPRGGPSNGRGGLKSGPGAIDFSEQNGFGGQSEGYSSEGLQRNGNGNGYSQGKQQDFSSGQAQSISKGPGSGSQNGGQGREEGYPSGGPQNNGRGFSNRRPQSGRNGENFPNQQGNKGGISAGGQEGYPSGGPSGLRGSGY